MTTDTPNRKTYYLRLTETDNGRILVTRLDSEPDEGALQYVDDKYHLYLYSTLPDATLYLYAGMFIGSIEAT